MQRCLAVIPARYDSSRLPGKVLLPLKGKPVLQHVWERVRACPLVEDIVVATDDERVCEAVHAFGGLAVMTSSAHRSGTDRVAEVAAGHPAGVVVNVQGDEPLISPQTITDTVAPLLSDEGINMTTACIGMKNIDDLFDPNCVKVILNVEGCAVYFSRLPIPFLRHPGLTYDTYRAHVTRDPLLLKNFYKHIGIYGYRKDFLNIFVNLPESSLERMEKLEQLRAVEHGYRIRVVEVSDDSIGVDTEADYRRLKVLLEGA
jgi:3-deoxy-manno-octulosonate cytidylyltransferase (CMP-KDO synthetase)